MKENVTYINSIDGNAPKLGKSTIPFEPSVAMINDLNGGDWSAITNFYAYSRNDSFYPVYILDNLMRENTDVGYWSDIDNKLNSLYLAPGATSLGHAFLVMSAKAAVYLWKLYPNCLTGNRFGKDYRKYGDNVIFEYRKNPDAFIDIVRRLCSYLGVTYYPSGKLEKDYVMNTPGTILYPAKAACCEALYSLAYALWNDYDYARSRFGVTWQHVQKYNKLMGTPYTASGFYENGFCDDLQDAFCTYDSILKLSERFLHY